MFRDSFSCLGVSQGIEFQDFGQNCDVYSSVVEVSRSRIHYCSGYVSFTMIVLNILREGIHLYEPTF